MVRGLLTKPLEQWMLPNGNAADIARDGFTRQVFFVVEFQFQAFFIVCWLFVEEKDNALAEEQAAELKWLRHNQAALDARLQRVEDSLIFRSLRAVGTFYQANFASDAGSNAKAYRVWARKHLSSSPSPDPKWRYQPLISMSGSTASLHSQTYTQWEARSGQGDYFGEVPAGVMLRPDALTAAVAAMQESRPGLIYFDHEITDESGDAVRPVFKPDWSPTLAESCDYTGPFVLRSREKRDGVIHVARVAYSARLPLVWRALEHRIQEHTPLVSILICTRNCDLLARCLSGLRARTDYPSLEIVVIHHTGSDSDAEIARLAEERGAVRLPYAGPFNFALMNNLGCQAAKGEILLFLNDDVEPLGATWLGRMVARLQQPEIGAVGAKLLYPNGTIQHAGVVTWEMGGAGHPGRSLTSSQNWPWLNATREVTAVTGAAMAVRREIFEDLGGFNPDFPVNFNDVDLCLRMRERGLSVILEAGALLQHDESRTRTAGVHFEERRRFFLRFHAQLERTDPFYSPFLAQNNENLSLRD